MRVLKWIGIVVGIILIVALVAGATIYFMGGRALARTIDATPRTVEIPTDAAAVTRGEHLVHHVNLCVDCHGDNLAGTILIDDPSLATLPAPNLTSGKGGIAGPNHTDAMWINAITQGIRADGRGLIVMPAYHYHALNDADLGAVVAYLKTLPPQDNEVGERKIGLMGHMLLGLGAIPLQYDVVKELPGPVAIAPAANAEYGKYIVEIGGCNGCHGENLAGGTDPNGPLGPNITSTLVGSWSEDQFVTFIRTGTLPTGGQVSDMMPWKKYSGMEDMEIQAIYAYLRTTPALPNNK